MAGFWLEHLTEIASLMAKQQNPLGLESALVVCGIDCMANILHRSREVQLSPAEIGDMHIRTTKYQQNQTVRFIEDYLGAPGVDISSS